MNELKPEQLKQWMTLQGYPIDSRALTASDLLHDLVEQVKEDCETFWRLHYTGKSRAAQIIAEIGSWEPNDDE